MEDPQETAREVLLGAAIHPKEVKVVMARQDRVDLQDHLDQDTVVLQSKMGMDLAMTIKGMDDLQEVNLIPQSKMGSDLCQDL